MSDRVARDPSPFRSGVVHTALSLAVFSGLFGLAGTGIHLLGDASAASPALQIALFEPANTDRPQLKTRFASTDTGIRPAMNGQSVEAVDAAYTSDDGTGPSLGIDYDDGTARMVRASASADATDSVRINGVSVSSGQSWQETREIASLPRSPVMDVTERTSVGYLPRIADDGRTPAGIYARPFANPENRPTVSIIVGGLGINWRHTESAIDELPPEITLSFAPTASDLQGWINKARAAGHEVLIEVPMEPYEFGREHPHAKTLYSANGEDELTSRLNYLMSRSTGYFGVTNYQGSKLATDEAATAIIARALKGRGVAFIEDGSLTRSSFPAAAEQTGLRYRRADNPIDARPEGEEIETKLLELEALALENGSSLGTGFAYPITIDMLKVWSGRLEEKGIVLAPASSVTRAARKPEPVVDTAQVDETPGGQVGG